MAETEDGAQNFSLRHLAALARLRLSPELQKTCAEKFPDILAMIDQLRSEDVGDIEPLSHPLDLSQRRRPDRVEQHLDRKVLQDLAPEVRDGFYTVPRVVD